MQRRSRFGGKAEGVEELTPENVEEAVQAAIAEAKRKAQAIAAKIGNQLGLQRPNPNGNFGYPEPKRRRMNKFERKVVVPQEAEPQTNFVGLIVGRGGATKRWLEERTECRIFVNGRGAQRDPTAHNPDAEEPLHVKIIGEDEEKVVEAEKFIHDILYDAEKRTQLPNQGQRPGAQQYNQQRQHYGHQQQGYPGPQYGGPPRGYGGPHFGAPPSNWETTFIEIAKDKVGLVIGKGGCSIRYIQEQSGARVQVDQSEDPEKPDVRKVIIKGTPDTIAAAKTLVEQCVSSKKSKVVKIPMSTVGMVIGKGGMVIKDLQARCQCNIQIQRNEEADASCETRDVTISGYNQEWIDYCETEIMAVISGPPTYPGGAGRGAGRGHPGGYAQDPYTAGGYGAAAAMGAYANAYQQQPAAMPAIPAMVLKVPEEDLPKLTGGAPSKLMEIKAATGAAVVVASTVENKLRAVTIDGALYARDMAKQHIDAVLGYSIPPEPILLPTGWQPPAPVATPGVAPGYPPPPGQYPPPAARGYPPSNGHPAPPPHPAAAGAPAEAKPEPVATTQPLIGPKPPPPSAPPPTQTEEEEDDGVEQFEL